MGFPLILLTLSLLNVAVMHLCGCGLALCFERMGQSRGYPQGEAPPLQRTAIDGSRVMKSEKTLNLVTAGVANATTGIGR